LIKLKELRECECGRKFWTNVRKVFVIKKRLCSDCGEPLERKKNTDIFVCSKCGKEFVAETSEYMDLGVKIYGTTVDKKEVERKKAEGYEVEKVLIPEHDKCQKCRHLEKMREDFQRRVKKKLQERPARVIPKEEMVKVYHREVQRLHAREIQQRRAEERKKQRVLQELKETIMQRKRLEQVEKELAEDIEKKKKELEKLMKKKKGKKGGRRKRKSK